MPNEWLTPDTVRDEAQSKIDEVRNVREQPAVNSLQLLNNPMVDGRGINVGSATASIRKSRNALAGRPFVRSIGVAFEIEPTPENHQTWYVSDSKEIGGNNADLNIVPWTHWIGRVANQLRDQLERGNRPLTLFYGPDADGHKKELPVGPLVEYQIEAENIIDYHFFDTPQAPTDSDDAPPHVKTTTTDDEGGDDVINEPA
ncbi:MAG: hypothetical protein O3B13_02820, partial [Planctomycetota bacterium]|nr:hypothetical protein [Planctomycetota bacterium]